MTQVEAKVKDIKKMYVSQSKQKRHQKAMTRKKRKRH